MQQSDKIIPDRRPAMSLIEVILATAVLSAIAAALLMFTHQPAERVKQSACDLQIEQLQAIALQYEADTGRMPRSDLRELAAQEYLGKPIPRCPLDGRRFRLNRRTGQIVAHAH